MTPQTFTKREMNLERRERVNGPTEDGNKSESNWSKGGPVETYGDGWEVLTPFTEGYTRVQGDTIVRIVDTV